jgi:hypothetical protein
MKQAVYYREFLVIVNGKCIPTNGNS